MLSSGIYEQIVNTRISTELSKLNPEQYDIQLESLDADDARRILTIYISYVIQQGLHYIRDSFPASRDRDSLIAQIKLCNDIVTEVAIHTKEPDFEDNQILEKGEILMSLYQKLNSARAIAGKINQKVVRPETSIIATTYTQATDYKAIMTLAELPNTTVKINYETNHARMHAKSYLFKRDTGFSTAYIGSSNLSNPALTGGLEWNVKVTEKESFDIVKKFSVSFESYWNDDTFETFDPKDEACRKKLQDELSKPMFEKNNQRHLQLEFRPYAYQQEILDNLEAEREVHGHYNNLVVAATGVGKTVIAAFDYKRFKQANKRQIREQGLCLLLTEKRFWSRVFRHSRRS